MFFKMLKINPLVHTKGYATELFINANIKSNFRYSTMFCK